MSQPDSHSSLPTIDSATDETTWDRVADAIDALSDAWETYLDDGGDVPDLAQFVPQEKTDVRQFALPELVKVDLEYRWQGRRQAATSNDLGPTKKIEEYVEQFPELRTGGRIPTELIHEELQVRMQAGDRVTEDEVRQRFPDQADTLCDMVGGMAVAGTPTCTYFAETLNAGSLNTDVKLVEDDAPELQPGDRVDDFELLTQLGRGAFAQVFLARQVSMERLVALKISDHRGSEPQTLAQLDHPNIVRVFDQRTSAAPKARLLYMEVVPGGTLQEVVRRVREAERYERTGQLLLDSIDRELGGSGVTAPVNSSNRNWLVDAPWSMVVCQIGAQLAEGLAYAHEKGVMHRDIKPANVLLTPEGGPKLADFNVSYNGGRADESPEDTFGGSLVYMSPEQLQACHPVLGGSPQLVRGTSDVYSLGVMLWELLTGERPFADEPKDSGGELARIQRMADQRHYADFTELCKQLPRDCPESLRQVLVRCLQPRKEERYASAEEAAKALRLCLDPASWKLMQEPKRGFSRLILDHPLISVVVCGFTPNALAGWFNYEYNHEGIIAPMSPSFANRFHITQLTVNSIAFPLGIAIGIWAAKRAMRLLERESSREDSALGGHRVLMFGRFVSMFALVMWTVSGLVFPLAIGWGQDVPGVLHFYVHFFVSLALCGFAAVAYPYFLLTAVATRIYVPALVRNGVLEGPQWRDLQKLRWWNKVQLALTVLVPVFGAGLAIWIDSEQKGQLLIAIAVGLVGFIAMFALERYIDRTLNALEKIAVDPPRRLT